MQKYTEKKRDLWFGIIVIIIGLAYALSIPFQVSATSEAGRGQSIISGRTLPAIITGLLLFLGSLLTWKSAATLRGLTRNAGERTAPAFTLRHKRALAYLGAILAYFFAISLAGFEISSAGMLVFSMWFFGCRSKLTIILCAILTPLLIYLSFAELMQMVMPDSLLMNYLLETFY